MTMRVYKQRKWQEKFVKKLQSMTGSEMALTRTQGGKHKHTHVHAIERWMESSLKSNQCPIDFDTFRGLRGIQSTHTHTHMQTLACSGPGSTQSDLIAATVDDSGESFSKITHIKK